MPYQPLFVGRSRAGMPSGSGPQLARQREDWRRYYGQRQELIQRREAAREQRRQIAQQLAQQNADRTSRENIALLDANNDLALQTQRLGAAAQESALDRRFRYGENRQAQLDRLDVLNRQFQQGQLSAQNAADLQRERDILLNDLSQQATLSRMDLQNEFDQQRDFRMADIYAERDYRGADIQRERDYLQQGFSTEADQRRFGQQQLTAQQEFERQQQQLAQQQGYRMDQLGFQAQQDAQARREQFDFQGDQFDQEMAIKRSGMPREQQARANRHLEFARRRRAVLENRDISEQQREIALQKLADEEEQSPLELYDPGPGLSEQFSEEVMEHPNIPGVYGFKDSKGDWKWEDFRQDAAADPAKEQAQQIEQMRQDAIKDALKFRADLMKITVTDGETGKVRSMLSHDQIEQEYQRYLRDRMGALPQSEFQQGVGAVLDRVGQGLGNLLGGSPPGTLSSEPKAESAYQRRDKIRESPAAKEIDGRINALIESNPGMSDEQLLQLPEMEALMRQRDMLGIYEPPRPQSQEDYDLIPSGTEYYYPGDPPGKRRVKP